MTNTVDVFKHPAAVGRKEQCAVDFSYSEVYVGYFLVD